MVEVRERWEREGEEREREEWRQAGVVAVRGLQTSLNSNKSREFSRKEKAACKYVTRYATYGDSASQACDSQRLMVDDDSP